MSLGSCAHAPHITLDSHIDSPPLPLISIASSIRLHFESTHISYLYNSVVASLANLGVICSLFRFYTAGSAKIWQFDCIFCTMLTLCKTLNVPIKPPKGEVPATLLTVRHAP